MELAIDMFWNVDEESYQLRDLVIKSSASAEKNSSIECSP